MTTPDANARRYARIKYRIALIDLVGQILFLAAFQFTGLSAWAARLVAPLPGEWLRLAAYLAILGTCSYTLFLPLHVYSSYILEHRFGLSRLTVNAWLVREAKHLLVGSGFALLLMEGLYAILRTAGPWWILYATIGWVVVSIVLARIFPTLVDG